MLHILLPMAGAGSRFVKEGYKLPKPLLDIDGEPMVVKAVKMLPSAQKHSFIIRTAHQKKYQIDKILSDNFSDSTILPINYLTEGQASTCLLAKNEINNSDELIIAACDNGLIYNQEELNKLQKNADAIVFTFRNNKAVLSNPNAYGWVIVNKADALGVSVKKQISDNPMNDHAIVGAFWFRKGSYFVQAAEKMIAENRRINNEFYVDECITDLIELGLKVKVFEIDEYICWGTPEDYEWYKSIAK